MQTRQQFIKKVQQIQTKLKAPKSQRNTFGNYNYRTCEDILEAVKPLLAEEELVLTLNDEVILVLDRVYVKSTVTITDGENYLVNSALAREPLEKKGSDASQITGGSSSYARKYALNGLFLIDDTKDADATNTHDKTTVVTSAVKESSHQSLLSDVPVADTPRPSSSFRRPGKTLIKTNNDW
jgi:ERF superfamily